MTLPRSSPPPRLSAKKHKALKGKKVYSTITKRGGKPKPNAKRKRKNFARQYGSEERVIFVRSLPCSACYVVGYSENAHVGRRSGIGRKGPYTEIAPLCGPRIRAGYSYIGCHRMLDEHPSEFYVEYPGFQADYAMRKTEEAWQVFSTTAGSTT